MQIWSFYIAEALIYVVFGVSLNLLLGYAGQVSVAQAAFGAIGGYLTGYFMISSTGTSSQPSSSASPPRSLPAHRGAAGAAALGRVPHPADLGHLFGDPRVLHDLSSARGHLRLDRPPQIRPFWLRPEQSHRLGAADPAAGGPHVLHLLSDRRVAVRPGAEGHPGGRPGGRRPGQAGAALQGGGLRGVVGVRRPGRRPAGGLPAAGHSRAVRVPDLADHLRHGDLRGDGQPDGVGRRSDPALPARPAPDPGDRSTPTRPGSSG